MAAVEEGAAEMPMWKLECAREEELRELCLQYTALCTSFITKVPPFSYPASQTLSFAALSIAARSAFTAPQRIESAFANIFGYL